MNLLDFKNDDNILMVSEYLIDILKFNHGDNVRDYLGKFEINCIKHIAFLLRVLYNVKRGETLPN